MLFTFLSLSHQPLKLRMLPLNPALMRIRIFTFPHRHLRSEPSLIIRTALGETACCCVHRP
jgi:hypothetical protein